jgi:hypothetical protein
MKLAENSGARTVAQSNIVVLGSYKALRGNNAASPAPWLVVFAYGAAALFGILVWSVVIWLFL